MIREATGPLPFKVVVKGNCSRKMSFGSKSSVRCKNIGTLIRGLILTIGTPKSWYSEQCCGETAEASSKPILLNNIVYHSNGDLILETSMMVISFIFENFTHDLHSCAHKIKRCTKSGTDCAACDPCNKRAVSMFSITYSFVSRLRNFIVF